MKFKSYISKILLLIPFIVAGCYPQGPEYTEDLDVVLTNYNSKYAFKSNSTYAIPDKIVKITGNIIKGDPPQYVPDAKAAAMLSRMEQNMNSLGYTKVDIANSPDVILAPAALETTTIVYWYDYWGWYWGGYYPGWGYPWYGYGYPAATSYSAGTLIMILVDPDQVGADGNPVGQWVGAANGIMTYTYDVNRVNRAIDQAFNQSPYLKK